MVNYELVTEDQKNTWYRMIESTRNMTFGR